MPLVIDYRKIVDDYNRRLGTSYTPHEFYKRVYSKNRSMLKAAEHIGMSEQSFRNALVEFGVPVKPRTGNWNAKSGHPTYKEKLEELTDEQIASMTLRQICRAIDVPSKSFVSQILARTGRKCKHDNPPGRPSPMKDRFLEFAKTGEAENLTSYQIANKLDISLWYVKNLLCRYKVNYKRIKRRIPW